MFKTSSSNHRHTTKRGYDSPKAGAVAKKRRLFADDAASIQNVSERHLATTHKAATGAAQATVADLDRLVASVKGVENLIAKTAAAVEKADKFGAAAQGKVGSVVKKVEADAERCTAGVEKKRADLETSERKECAALVAKVKREAEAAASK